VISTTRIKREPSPSPSSIRRWPNAAGPANRRLALGAQQSQILLLVVGHGMRLAAIGIAAGLAFSLVVTRMMARFFFGVSAADPLTIIAITLILAGVAMLACHIPARRAMKVDPLVALRHD
jgi:ABC-type lipoprotein release transport system permease subunit